MGVNHRPQTILLDLDGVVIYGGNPAAGASATAYLLHPELAKHLCCMQGVYVILLTHRSGKEAKLLATALRGLGVPIKGVVSASSLLWSAVKGGDLASLARRGISKGFAIKILKHRYSLRREQMIAVDDHEEILREIVEAGAAKGFLAPFSDQGDSVWTFDFNELITYLNNPEGDSNITRLRCIKRDKARLIPLCEVSRTRFDFAMRLRQTAKRLRSQVRSLLRR